MKKLLSEKLKDVDSFGKPISLMYNERSRFKTACGGVLTILIIVLTLLYVVLLAMEPTKIQFKDRKITETSADKVVGISINQNSTLLTNQGVSPTLTWMKITDTKETSKYKENAEDTTVHKLSKSKWAFAITYLLQYDESYLFVNAFQVTRNSGGETGVYIPSWDCSPDVFPMENYTRAINYGVSKGQCPGSTNIEAYGDLASTNTQYIDIVVLKCRGYSE